MRSEVNIHAKRLGLSEAEKLSVACYSRALVLLTAPLQPEVAAEAHRVWDLTGNGRYVVYSQVGTRDCYAGTFW